MGTCPEWRASAAAGVALPCAPMNITASAGVSRTPPGRTAAVVLTVACAAMLAAWFAFDLFAAGAPWWGTAIALLALAAPVALLARGVQRRRARVATVAVVATAVAVALLPWCPRKRFVAALHSAGKRGRARVPRRRGAGRRDRRGPCCGAPGIDFRGAVPILTGRF